MEKTCTKCNEVKSIDCFNKQKSSKDGHRSHCKICQRSQFKKYYKNPKVKENEKKRKSEYLARPEIKQHYKEYFSRQDVIKRKKETDKKYYNVRNSVLREKYKNNVDYKLKTIYRSKIHKFLKGIKTHNSINYLGCDIGFFKKWIEFRFSNEMNWDNFGSYWHIDHILPISKFDFTIEKNRYICSHWTNLQPLEASINQSKLNNYHLHYYFNNIVNVFRFNSVYKQFLGYQAVNESLSWLRVELRNGKNAPYNDTNIVSEMDNPQPSS